MGSRRERAAYAQHLNLSFWWLATGLCVYVCVCVCVFVCVCILEDASEDGSSATTKTIYAKKTKKKNKSNWEVSWAEAGMGAENKTRTLLKRHESVRLPTEGHKKRVNQYIAISSLMLRAINCNKAFDTKLLTLPQSLYCPTWTSVWSSKIYLKTWQLTYIR